MGAYSLPAPRGCILTPVIDGDLGWFRAALRHFRYDWSDAFWTLAGLTLLGWILYSAVTADPGSVPPP